ncbi:MAG TPA: hypothetical protein VIG69_12720 [Candidatus Methylomirabilis sp.]|jgi:hypothetical protein
MTRPAGFGSYRNFYVEIWQDEREAWWAFLHVTPAGAMRTHHATGNGVPVSGGPWTSRDDAIDAAKTACDAARAVRAPSAVPRCAATHPRRFGQRVRPRRDRAD